MRSVVHEHCQYDDDRQGYADQPQKQSSTKAHGLLHLCRIGNSEVPARFHATCSDRQADGPGGRRHSVNRAIAKIAIAQLQTSQESMIVVQVCHWDRRTEHAAPRSPLLFAHHQASAVALSPGRPRGGLAGAGARGMGHLTSDGADGHLAAARSAPASRHAQLELA